MLKTLIFVAIGDNIQQSWFSCDSNAEFVAAYYGKNDEKYEKIKENNRVIYSFRSKGVKFQLLWSWWIHNSEKTKDYDIIGVVDDDLQWNYDIFNKFLEFIENHMLYVDKDAVVYSPSHHLSGKITREHMQQQFKQDIRKVHAVEMTWVFFKRDFLDSYLYNEYEVCLLGYGEGRLYSNKANKEKKNLYVVDKFSSINPTDFQKGLPRNEMLGKYPYCNDIWEIIKKSKGIILS